MSDQETSASSTSGDQETTLNDLPTYPEGILEWNDGERAMFPEGRSQPAILRDKLWFIWQTWANARNDRDACDLVNTKSEEWLPLQKSYVTLIDSIGKILGSTPIQKDFSWLEKHSE